MPGKAEFAVIHDKRAYLFPSAKERDVFKADTKKCERADVAQGGYCSVCVVTAKKRVAGKLEIVSVYDGIRYYFPGADEKKSFDADPAKFTPALEGDCVVCLKDAGKRVAGQPKFSAMHDWRIYLFPDEGAQKKFIADPKKYSTVDVAMGCNCAVCAKMMKKEMPGKAEFTSVYKDQRYFFPSPAAAASRSWVTSAMWVELTAGRRRHLTKRADGPSLLPPVLPDAYDRSAEPLILYHRKSKNPGSPSRGLPG